MQTINTEKLHQHILNAIHCIIQKSLKKKKKSNSKGTDSSTMRLSLKCTGRCGIFFNSGNFKPEQLHLPATSDISVLCTMVKHSSQGN